MASDSRLAPDAHFRARPVPRESRFAFGRFRLQPPGYGRRPNGGRRGAFSLKPEARSLKPEPEISMPDPLTPMHSNGAAPVWIGLALLTLAACSKSESEKRP